MFLGEQEKQSNAVEYQHYKNIKSNHWDSNNLNKFDLLQKQNISTMAKQLRQSYRILTPIYSIINIIKAKYWLRGSSI